MNEQQSTASQSQSLRETCKINYIGKWHRIASRDNYLQVERVVCVRYNGRDWLLTARTYANRTETLWG